MIKAISKITKEAEMLDLNKLECEIKLIRHKGVGNIIKAVITTNQFKNEGKKATILAQNMWYFTKTMKNDPKSKKARRDYTDIMEKARAWLTVNVNLHNTKAKAPKDEQKS